MKNSNKKRKVLWLAITKSAVNIRKIYDSTISSCGFTLKYCLTNEA